MRAYVLAQQDDKPINMRANHTRCVMKDSGCGCLMYQYAKDVLHIDDDIWCGTVNISPADVRKIIIAKINFPMSYFIEYGFESEARTFGELKKTLIPTE